MKLRKLTANKPSFRTIEFKEGLNIILAKKTNPEDDSLKKTYNGVGKSLAIALVHFCLAANENKEFGKKLPGWEFSLEFEINGELFKSTRSTENQKTITVNGESLSLEEFHKKFAEKLFLTDSSIPYLKFRPLISRFARPRKKSYIAFDVFESKESSIGTLTANGYLLGLEVSRIKAKYDLKKEFDKVADLKRNIEKDEIFQAYFSSNKKMSIEIADLKEKIQKIDKNLIEVKIAEDYQKIREEEKNLSQEMRRISNRIIIIKTAVQNIERTLQLKADTSTEKVKKLFEEAQVHFPESVFKTVKQAESFHKNLLQNREQRLLEEKRKLQKQINDFEVQFQLIGNRRDDRAKYLKEHGALEEFTAMTVKLSELRGQLQKLETYKGALESYDAKRRAIQLQLDQENISTDEYLTQSKDLLQRNLDIFRMFSRQFYEDKPGGIQITNNDGDNQTRFDIAVSIQDDTSDGINEVKIFCFDLTLLVAHHNHRVNFLFHDSRLFSNMDPRQRATLFKIVNSITASGDFQYIATANEDMTLQLKELYGAEEYSIIIEQNILPVQLTDESDKSKLLGIEVDLKYEED